MTTVTRIVAGFDDTPSGFDAVALGRRLAEATGAGLIVTHVYPTPAVTAAGVVLDPMLGERVHAEAEERLAHAGAALEGFDRWEGVVYACVPPARGLHDVAERHGADLLVVSSTHRHGPGRVVPGTTADKLLHGSSFPVAVAPAGWRDNCPSTIRSVGAGFDGSAESAGALAAAAALAGSAGADLHAVAVFEPPNPASPIFAVTSHGYHEISRDLRDALERRLGEALAALPAGVAAHGEVIDGHAADVLSARSGEFDLLAVGSRGWGALRAVVMGTLTHDLVSRSHCPLLIVPRGVDAPLATLSAGRRHAGAN